jgi:hypothetical protein
MAVHATNRTLRKTYIDQTLGADSASMLAEVFNEISTILNEVRTSLAHVEPLAIASAGTLVRYHLFYWCGDYI